jgi:alkylation response protein AidB-like acyl-CoA dehydrogenase
MTTGATGSVLTDDLLARCLERAPKCDQENRFFQEDFDELKAASYLNIAVPKKLGGGGVSLAEVGRETRKLAYYAHATAVALNMHI